MKNNTDFTDLFIRHSRKQLSESELVDFCQRLTTDATFKTAFEEYELTRQFFIQKELFDVKNILSELNNTPPTPNYTNYWIGGSVLVLILGISTFFGLRNTKSPEKEEIISSITPEKEIIESIPVVEEKKSTPIIEKIDTTKSIKNSVVTPQKEKIIVSKEIDIDPRQFNDKRLDSIIPTVEKTSTTIKNNITKENTENTTKTPCATISFDVLTEKPCKNDDNGTLKINNITGGTSPYHYYLNKNKQENAAFRNLESGSYTIKVVDKMDCFSTKTITIEEKNCIAKHYEFSYSYQSSLEIPIQENGKFTILNEQGKILITINLTENSVTEWNGLDQHGNSLVAGLYPIIITLNNEKVAGSIRIYP